MIGRLKYTAQNGCVRRIRCVLSKSINQSIKQSIKPASSTGMRVRYTCQGDQSIQTARPHNPCTVTPLLHPPTVEPHSHHLRQPHHITLTSTLYPPTITCTPHPTTTLVFVCCCFTSYQHLTSYQDGYRFVTVRSPGDFIVLPPLWNQPQHQSPDIPLNHIILILSQPVLVLS